MRAGRQGRLPYQSACNPGVSGIGGTANGHRTAGAGLYDGEPLPERARSSVAECSG